MSVSNVEWALWQNLIWLCWRPHHGISHSLKTSSSGPFSYTDTKKDVGDSEKVFDIHTKTNQVLIIKKRNRATLILGIYIMKYYFPVNGKHGFPRRLFDISVLRQKCQQCSVTAAAKTYTVHYWMWTRSGEISETRSVSWHHFSEWRICVFEELRVMEVMSHWCGALESRRYTFLFFSASN